MSASQSTSKLALPAVIGLLGGVASGKSAVAAHLQSLGAVVLDADQEVGGLLASPEIIQQISREISEDAVTNGVIQKRRLADIIFTDDNKRARLEAILHPPVIEAARQLIADPPLGATAIVIDAPLLLEASMDSLCDELWFVETPREHRLRRAKATRGWSEDELDRRERIQLSIESKRQRAHRVLPNDADLKSLIGVVDAAWDALKSPR